ncbi:MAG: MerR family transcriptional regulator [Acidiferrobacteraceae bacterium]|nr:MerR family transcriptional regulator [Acidiferrobacteraceae bacterium]|tara:strand:+ start:4269 stop:4910 length:642 start_codon:yes stop_codon:yes gene_type:complete
MTSGNPLETVDGGPIALSMKRGNRLEDAIGRQVRIYRVQLSMTIADLARQSGLSPGMLSKIENGQTSPSLTTLQLLAGALNVPVTALFRKYEQDREASFVQAGKGLVIDRRGTGTGHQYHLLGHSVGDRSMRVEPYLIVISEASDVFPLFQHEGVEFIYMLEGEMMYRHGSHVYTLNMGDSLYFDSDAPHGPEDLNRLPIRFLSFIVEPNSDS